MRILFLILFLLFPSVSWATCHLYIVPHEVDEEGSPVPKYVSAAGVNWSAIRYGAQQIYLAAADVSDTQDTNATKQSDVTRLPDNLDLTLGANLATVQAKLEAVNIPGHWLTAATTYRTMLRTVVNMLLFTQRFHGVNKFYSSLFSGGISLDTPFNALSANYQNYLINAAKSFGLSTAGLTGSSTMRQILKAISDQMGLRPIVMSCLTI